MKISEKPEIWHWHQAGKPQLPCRFQL